MAILDVRGLTVEFQMEGRVQPTVTDVSFSLEKGEILALVGESGCGKSVSCMALARLLPSPPARIAGGEVMLCKRSGEVVDVLRLSPRELRKIRGGEIAYIFQEPSVSLNPVFRVGEQIAEAVSLHRPDVGDPWEEAVELLRQVGIPEPRDRVSRYPHELSGGMQQRVMIAMAIASRAGRRRTHHCAGCDDSGADSGSASGSPPQPGHVDHPGDAQSRDRLRDRRQCRGDVCGKGCRIRPCAGTDRRAGTSLHKGTPRGGSCARTGKRPPLHDSRFRSLTRELPGGMPLLGPLCAVRSRLRCGTAPLPRHRSAVSESRKIPFLRMPSV